MSRPDALGLGAPISGAPIIVSALFRAADQAWLDGLRRAHFPPERNQLDAHLALFHHLPPSVEAVLRRRLAEFAHAPAPRAEATELLNLGRGVAIRIVSPELQAMRAELAEAFRGVLIPQDANGWRPHVTIQNKVQPEVARTLLGTLGEEFAARPVIVRGLACWWYRGGPWEQIARYAFRG